MWFSIFLIPFMYFSCIDCFVVQPKTMEKEGVCSNNQEKLHILTPLIHEGKIKEAQEIAEFQFKDFKHIKQYAGYLTVSEYYNSNLFFWFFPSENDYETDPIILWLQGGPGVTSMFGLFVENGPFQFIREQDCKLTLREHSWSKNHSVIYIDNPVGTGFSFTDKEGYAKNQTIIGEHLYEALLQFFQLFPELQKNDFFVAGESYAGKYVPAVSYTIHKNNPLAKQKINIKGLAIGNGWSDPEHQLGYGDFVYQLGLIDSNTKKEVQEAAELCVKYIHQENWSKALQYWAKVVFESAKGTVNAYNYVIDKDDTLEIDKCIAKKLPCWFNNNNFTINSGIVYGNLHEDILKSVAPWISTLLSHYKILIYNGQLDTLVPYVSTVNFLENLNFSGADEYKSANRHNWLVGDELAGFFKQAGNLTEVLVRNAGHMVPMDQPLWALDLISKFTHNQI